MTMKCDICGNKVEETFLKKVVGAYMKNSKGKKKIVCPKCQKDLKTKEKILEKLD